MDKKIENLIALINWDCQQLTTFPHPDLTACWHKDAVAFIEENWDVI